MFEALRATTVRRLDFSGVTVQSGVQQGFFIGYLSQFCAPTLVSPFFGKQRSMDNFAWKTAALPPSTPRRKTFELISCKPAPANPQPVSFSPELTATTLADVKPYSNHR